MKKKSAAHYDVNFVVHFYYKVTRKKKSINVSYTSYYTLRRKSLEQYNILIYCFSVALLNSLPSFRYLKYIIKMKFTSAFSIALLSLAKLALADSETFGLLTIKSGSNLQYASVFLQDGKLHFGSETTLSGVITDDGKLKFADGTFAIINKDSTISVGDESQGSAGFSIESGYLAHEGTNGFYALQDGSSYLVTVESGNGATGVGISARSTNGDVVPDFPTADDNTTTNNGTTTTEAPFTNTTTLTDSQTTLSTLTSCSDNACNYTSTTESRSFFTENGANHFGSAGVGAGLLAAAALLI